MILYFNYLLTKILNSLDILFPLIEYTHVFDRINYRLKHAFSSVKYIVNSAKKKTFPIGKLTNCSVRKMTVFLRNVIFRMIFDELQLPFFPESLYKLKTIIECRISVDVVFSFPVCLVT